MAKDTKVNILITAENKAKAGFNSVKQSASELKGFLSSLFGVSILGFFTNDLINTVRTIQDLRLKLSGLTDSQQDFANSEAYLTDLAKRHHKAVGDLTDNYAKLLIMEDAGVITRQQSMQMLEGFSNVMSKTGASSTQTGQALYGLSQALGQGTVQSAEFNQIIEPLAGFGNKIAEAFGVKSVGALRAMIGAGQVTSEIFGKKVVQALETYKGAAERSAGTITATYADVGTSYTEFAKKVEKPIAAFAVKISDTAMKSLNFAAENKDSIIAAVEAIALAYVARGAGALAIYARSVYANIEAEKAARASSLAEAQEKLASAEATRIATGAKVNESAAAIRLIDSNLALVRSDAAANAQSFASTNARIAAAKSAISSLTATVELAEAQLVLARNELLTAEAAYSQSLSNSALLSSQAAAITSSLNQARAQETVAATALASASANVNLIESNLALVNSDRAAETAALKTANAQIARSKAAIAAMSTTTQSTSIQYLLRQETEKLTIAENARATALSKLGVLGSKAGAISETLALSKAQQAAAQATLNEAKANTTLLDSNLAAVKSDIAATNSAIELANARIASAKAALTALQSDAQTIEARQLLAVETAKLTAAQTELSAATARQAALGRQANEITAQRVIAGRALAEATALNTAAINAEIVAQNELGVVASRTSLLMTKVGSAAKSAMSLVGGGAGLALIGLFALYTALEKIMDVEGQAAQKAKLFSDAVAKAGDEIKKMSLIEVELDTKNTDKSISDIKGKIKELETFKISKLFDVNELANQRANLTRQLDVLSERKKQLAGGANDKLMNFDSSTVSAEKLNDELISTQTEVAKIEERIKPLKDLQIEGKLNVYSESALKEDELRLNALNSKISALQGDSRLKDTSNSPLSKTQRKEKAKQDKLDAKIEDENFKNQIERLKQNEAEQIRIAEKSYLDKAALAKTELDKQGLDSEINAIKMNSAVAMTNFLRGQYVIEKNDILAHQSLKVAFNEKELLSKKETLKRIEDSQKESISNLISIEKEHHDKAIAAQNEIANLHKTGAEKLREIERAGMTDAQLKADKELEITQKTAQVKELIKKGEFAKAAEEGKKLQDLTATAAMDANSQVKTGELPWYEGALAADKYKESLTLTEQALQGVSTAEQEKEEAAAMQRAEQEIKLRETKGVIDAINTALASKKMLEIVADTKAIDAVKTAIDTIPNVKRIKIEFGENGVPSFSEAASVTNKAVANNKTGVTSDSEKILGRYVISMGDAGNINAIADKAADVTLEKLKKYNRTAT